MNRYSTILVLLLVTSAACAAPKSENQTQITVSPTSPATLTRPVEEMPSIGDGGLFSGQPCESPCFFGVHVGETPFDQVIAILETNGIYPCHQVNERNIFCSAANIANVVVAMNKSTLLVDGISYNPSVSVLLGDIIEKYGDPNSVYVESGGTPEATTLSMLVLWDSIKMGANLGEIPDIGTQSYVVESATEVQWISFNEVNYIESSQPWNGYGTYKP